MVRGLIAVGVVAVTFACGCSGESQDRANSSIDQLLSDIVTGGEARVKAANTLAQTLNRDPSARASNGELADRTVETLVEELEPLVGDERPTCGSWADRPKYTDLQFATELALHVAGNSGSERGIRRGLELNDPYLVAWAIRAATAADVPVDSALVRRVARDDYARSVLYLGERSIEEQLPAALTSDVARARADMTQWLVFPTELGCVPTDLEVMKAIDLQNGRYFVFRFRAGGSKSANDRMFKAGISGPWNDRGELAAESHTFSDFEPADSASAEAHLDRIVGLERRARD